MSYIGVVGDPSGRADAAIQETALARDIVAPLEGQRKGVVRPICFHELHHLLGLCKPVGPCWADVLNDGSEEKATSTV